MFMVRSRSRIQGLWLGVGVGVEYWVYGQE